MAFAQTAYDLEMFKLAYAVAIELRPLLKEFPKYEQFGGVADQMRRASSGVCANLVEGFAKGFSKSEFRRFCGIALGSANEMIFWLRFSRDCGYLDDPTAQTYIENYEQVARMLNGFMSSLSSQSA
jgi:four helix bundle protein